MQIRKNTFTFGSIALVIATPLLLTSTNLGRIQLKLKRSCSKRDKTYRKFWIRAFPSFPLTRKSTNARMGKGRGKLKGWFCRVKAGSLFVEVKNLRIGRGRFFLNQIRAGLRSSDFITFRSNRFVTSPVAPSRRYKIALYFKHNTTLTTL
jgi:ribosomal protein L16